MLKDRTTGEREEGGLSNCPNSIDSKKWTWGQFYKRFMSVFSWVYTHILWTFIKTNSINFFHESWLMTHENQFYKILNESRLIFHTHTEQAVIFSVYYEESQIWIFVELFFMEVGFHETRLILWRFIEIFLWAFIELTPIHN